MRRWLHPDTPISGCTAVLLMMGGKGGSADVSIYLKHDYRANYQLDEWLQIVREVGTSEPQTKLERDARFWAQNGEDAVRVILTLKFFLQETAECGTEAVADVSNGVIESYVMNNYSGSSILFDHTLQANQEVSKVEAILIYEALVWHCAIYMPINNKRMASQNIRSRVRRPYCPLRLLRTKRLGRFAKYESLDPQQCELKYDDSCRPAKRLPSLLKDETSRQNSLFYIAEAIRFVYQEAFDKVFSDEKVQRPQYPKQRCLSGKKNTSVSLAARFHDEGTKYALSKISLTIKDLNWVVSGYTKL
ncbi:hypothetical protein KEM56_001282, partial [Ascosphaera pollenicola]